MAATSDDDALLGAFEQATAEDIESPDVIAARLMELPEHAHLKDHEQRFLILMRAEQDYAAGVFNLGRVHKPEVQGKLRPLFEQLLVQCYGFMPDWIITIDRQWWREATPVQREALVFHELCHVKQAIDRFGELRFNTQTGEPIFELRAHDLEEFRSVVERYGRWKDDITAFEEALKRHG
jgi:hypothetical protein